MVCKSVVFVLLVSCSYVDGAETQVPEHKRQIITTDILKECRNAGLKDRPADHYIAPDNLIVRVGGKFLDQDKLLDTFNLRRRLGAGAQAYILRDIMYKADWNGNGNVGTMWLSGAETVVANFVVEQIEGYRKNTIYYDFDCEILNLSGGD